MKRNPFALIRQSRAIIDSNWRQRASDQKIIDETREIIRQTRESLVRTKPPAALGPQQASLWDAREGTVIDL